MKAPDSQAPELKFRSDLVEPIATSRSAEALLGKAIQAALDSPLPANVRSRNVTLKLLTRMIRDLRCSTALVVFGYPVQALSLVASVLEVAFTVAYIRDDNKRAQDWVDHRDPTRVFESVPTMLQDAIAQLNLPNHKDVVAKHYSTYRQLCMAKHVNPLLEKSFGVRDEEHRSVLEAGPAFDEDAFRKAWYALTNGAGLASIAIEFVLRCHIAPELVESVEQGLSALRTRVDDHTQFALSEGWDKDPYPGRWRLPS